MNIKWQIEFPFIVTYCEDCRLKFHIEYPSPTTHIVHCGKTRTRLPQDVYERWCDVRDNKKHPYSRWPQHDVKVRTL